MPNSPVPPNIPRTALLINTWLPKDLANIVLEYFKSKKRNWFRISYFGEYETCLSVPYKYVDKTIYGACFCNHIELVNLLIPILKSNLSTCLWNFGLYGACNGGSMELAELMIFHGANDFLWGLHGACRNHNTELAKLMHSKCGYDWNDGLRSACGTGHIEFAQFMISKGADDWDMGLSGACQNNHIELMRLMIDNGATRCSACRKPTFMH